MPTDAFAQRVTKAIHKQLLRYLARRLRSSEDVWDIAQETYLRLSKVDPNTVRNFLQYLFACAGSVLAEHYQKAALNPVETGEHLVHMAEAGDSSAMQDSSLEIVDLERDIVRAIKQLPPTQRRVFVMKAIDLKSYEQIARDLEITVETTKTYYFKAAARVRAAIKGSQGVPTP